MGSCESIVNMVISSCKIMFLLTDFQVLNFCWSLVSAKTRSKFICGAVDGWRNSVGFRCRGGIAGGWIGLAGQLFCCSRLHRSWLSSLMSIETGVDRWDRFSLLEIMLTSSLIRWEDWLSWPQSSKRSTCNCSSLRRLIILVCLLRIDVVVFWWGCCFITFCDIFLSSFSFALVRSISRDKDRNLFLCSMIFSKRSSWFFMAISVALNMLMANWHSAVICLDILLLVVLCWPFVAVVDVTLKFFIKG